ncbi:MAG: acyl-CoA dehydrogenase family protein [Clostridia bacterium]|nr:acyl-CoA dehydrogenase family protein [Clostridia bacterium]
MAIQDLAIYRQQVATFIATEGEAFARQLEAEKRIPDALMRRLRELGLLRLTIPKEYGGEGLKLQEYFPILEECAKSHGTIRILVHGINTLWRPLAYAGETQRNRWLTAIASGEAIPAFALTEPDTGTGADIGTMAVRRGDTYYLTGKKHLITFADMAHVFTVVACTDRSRRGEGVSAFIVERNTPGFTITLMPEMMNMKGSEHGILEFRDAPVPAENLIGREGDGLTIVLRGFLDQSRAAIAQSCVGIAQRSLDLATEFAKQRVTFGKPIAERQAVQAMIADMATEIHAGRLLVMDAARRFDEGLPLAREAAMAKLFCLEMVGRVTDRALRIFGGRGLTVAFPIERLYRDARALWFEEGTAEIQRTVIAREVLYGHP